MNAKTIVFLPAATGMAANWRKLSVDGHVLERSLLPPDATFEMVADGIAVAPAEDVSVRWLTLPKGSPLQLVAAARWQMSELLGHDLADDEVVLGQISPSGTTPVAVVRRSLLAAWQSWIEGAGLNVASLVPAQLCVPFDGEVVHAVRTATDSVIVSGDGLALTVASDWVETITEGRPVQWIEPDQALDTLAYGAISCPLNLLSSATPKGRKTAGWKQIAALAAVLALSPAWVGLFHIAHDKWAENTANTAAKALAVEFMPDLARQDDALEQAERRLAVQPPLGSYAKTIAALTTVIEDKPGSTMAEVAGTGGEVRGVLRLRSNEDIAAIRDGLLRYGLDFRDCDPVSEDGQTVCAFVIGAAR